MKAFIRENPLIAASVVLPLVLVVIFAIAGFLPKLLAPSPQYDLLLVDPMVSSLEVKDRRATIVVNDGRVQAEILAAADRDFAWRSRVYRVDRETLAIRRLEINWPEDSDALVPGELLSVAELENASISTSTVAPDGYRYRGYERGHGFVFGLFASGRLRNQVSIAKDGAVVRIPIPEDSEYGYGQMHFLGWVTEP